MGTTFKQLQDDCLNYGFNEFDRARFKTFLNDAMLDVCMRYRWTWYEGSTTLTLAVGQSSVVMPSMSTTPYQTGQIQKTTSPANAPLPEYIDYLTEGDDSWVNNPVTATGFPTEYTIWAGTVYFNRIAAAVTTYQLLYWTTPTRMVADTDEPVIPDHFREVLVWGALYRQALRDNDQSAARNFGEVYENSIMRMRQGDTKHLGSLKAKMPAHYGGAYS